jgi:sugar lactone lactonase YvrE
LRTISPSTSATQAATWCTDSTRPPRRTATAGTPAKSQNIAGRGVRATWVRPPHGYERGQRFATPRGPCRVDLDSGKSWRRLSGHPSVRATQRAGFGIATENGLHQITGGADGIALSPDGRTLWWTPLGSYDVYSIETDILSAPHPSPQEVERHVVRYDTRDFASDGLDCDREGRVYFTDVTHGTVQRLIPGESRYEKLFQGERFFIWPDAVKLGPDRLIYVTDTQVNRMPDFNGGQDLRTPPYRLYRAAIDADPAQY